MDEAKTRESFINNQPLIKGMYSDYEYLTKSDLSRYAGKWIAVCGAKIVASSKDIKGLIKKSKDKCGSKKPVITKVSDTARIL